MRSLLEKLRHDPVPGQVRPLARFADIDWLEERFRAPGAGHRAEPPGHRLHGPSGAQDNILSAFSLLDKFSDEQFAALQENEEAIDHYETSFGTYLIKKSRARSSRRARRPT